MSELIALLTGEALAFLPQGVVSATNTFDLSRKDEEETVCKTAETAMMQVRRKKASKSENACA